MGGVTASGIRHRPGRSVVVLALAVVAVAAAVLAPAYTAAAQQSMLTDGLRALSPVSSGLSVDAQGSAGSSAYAAVDQARVAVDASLAAYPGLDDVLGPAVAAVDTDAGGSARMRGVPDEPSVRLAYRDDVCGHVDIVSGACPAARGEVLLSERSANWQGVEVGETVTVSNGMAGEQRIDLVVSGLYAPRAEPDRYWGRTRYFDQGFDEKGTPRLDALFVSTDDDVRAIGGPKVALNMRFEYPLLPDRVQVSDVKGLVADLAAWDTVLVVDDRELLTGLPGTFDAIAADTEAIGESVPVVSIPLILLCWFVLFIVVANLSAARAPEVALAKLRGYHRSATIYFGLAEAMLLILLAAPIGILLGLGLVETTAAFVLADGTHTGLSGELFGYALAALAGAAVAATLGAWRTLSLPILDLLRRVPPRRGWRVGIVDGALAAVGAIALYQAYQARSEDADGSSTIVLLAPPLLALLVGVGAARLLGALARARVASSGGRGAVVALLTWSQIARRPAIRQVIVLITVAVSLLSFAAVAWQIGDRNRELVAGDTLGAHRVYEVTAANPSALIEAVKGIDPDGDFAMAVASTDVHYGQGLVGLVAVQSDRLGEVAIWRDHDEAWLDETAGALHPPGPDPLVVSGPLTITADVSKLDASRPMRLVARLAGVGEQPQTVRFGELEPGSGTYRAELPGCGGGCQLIGLGVSRFPGTFDDIDVELNIGSILDGDKDLSDTLTSGAAWRRPSDLTADISMRVSATPEGLRLLARSSDPRDLFAEHAAIPAALPTILSGVAPADDPDAVDFNFPGLHGRPQPFHIVGTDKIVPSGGTRALLTDLSYTAMQAGTSIGLGGFSTVTYEVWANAEAPADLDERLAAAGLPVVDTGGIDEHLDGLGRKAPALALRLYLLAAGAAVLLAVGTVLLTAQSASTARGYEVAALRVAGVGRKVLKSSIAKEYSIVIGVPLLLGLASGLAGAWLMLPTVPMVSAGGDALPTVYDASGPWPPAALAITVLGFAAAVWYAVVALRRNGRAARLREGEQ
ncbi:FtsX-like permease family protein [Phytomonospora sp. NPDC050363]|uniref:FtsX-like permease family protein n=1 Tax=Phytomonospora sp. NPDC050363 TaxID=3155642 RepID=UPI0033D78DD0